MIVSDFTIKYLIVTSCCPKCGRESGTDMGTYLASKLPKTAKFWCGNPECEQGEWEEPLQIVLPRV